MSPTPRGCSQGGTYNATILYYYFIILLFDKYRAGYVRNVFSGAIQWVKGRVTSRPRKQSEFGHIDEFESLDVINYIRKL